MDGSRGYYTQTKIAIILEINCSSVKKENVAYTYNGLFFSHEKEGNIVICNSVDETIYAKSNIERQILYDITYM